MDPLHGQGEEKSVGSSVMLVSGKEFLDVLKQEGTHGYALVMQPRSKTKKQIGVPRGDS